MGRTVGIGTGIAAYLAESGWDITLTYWNAYDGRMPWGVEAEASQFIGRSLGGKALRSRRSRPTWPGVLGGRRAGRLRRGRHRGRSARLR